MAARLICIGCLALSLALPGQSTDSLRYEALRQRMQDLFFRQNKGPGHALPVARIRLGVSCTHAFWFGEGCRGKGQVPEARHIFEFEDATAHLGFRMLLLGLEFKAHWMPQRARQELVECLNAIDRLDSLAGSWFGTSTSPNGFLLRDDALIDSHWPDTAGCIRGGWTCRARPGLGNLLSQDQAIYLSLGFYSWLNDSTHDFPEKQRTVDTWRRMLLRLSEQEWVIRDPLGKEVHIGSRMLPASIPLRRASKTAGMHLPKDPHAALFGRLLWLAWQVPEMSRKPPLHHEVNRGMQLALASMDAGYPWKRLARFAPEAGLELYPMLWWLWHRNGPVPHQNLENWESPNEGLFSEPLFEVPGHPNPPTGWRSESRWLHPDRAQGMVWEKNCLFNGMDRLIWWQTMHLLSKRN